jgi:hypothetical protein
MLEQHLKNRNKPDPIKKSPSHGRMIKGLHIHQSLGSTLKKNQQIGNRILQRLITQFDGGEDFNLDKETANRINHERCGGQVLDGNIQARMSEVTGQGFSNVKVHTGPASHTLNEQLNAKAFTTGSHIFFRNGAYNPNSSSGQELLAHELTHVIQQRSGAVGSGGGRMTVNAPGDRFEQEADAVAKAVTSQAATPDVQRQMPEEEDEELQTTSLQRQEIPEDKEEETLQRQELDEDEEELNV